jgi:hypothetical protein
MRTCIGSLLIDGMDRDKEEILQCLCFLALAICGCCKVPLLATLGPKLLRLHTPYPESFCIERRAVTYDREPKKLVDGWHLAKSPSIGRVFVS